MLERLFALIRENPAREKLWSALDRIERSQIHRLAHGVTLGAIYRLLASGEAVTIDRMETELARLRVMDEIGAMLRPEDSAPFDMAEFERLVDAIPLWIPKPGGWLVCSPRTVAWMRRKRKELVLARRAARRASVE